MKRYRIGDFAQKLGVTPDFLKYCERKGIITPEVEENGYRYYGFTQASRVLEYLKLKNQGYTGEEIRDLLHGSSYASAMNLMREKAEEVRRRIAFNKELLRYYEDMEAIQVNFGNTPVWQVRRCPGFYFLPHSVESEFIQGKDTEMAVRAWNACLPIVRSTYQIRRGENGWLGSGRSSNVWGFSIDENAAKRLDIYTGAPVQYVPSGRCLEVFSAHDLRGQPTALHDFTREIMRLNGFRLSADGYNMVVFKMIEDGVRREYSVLRLPLED